MSAHETRDLEVSVHPFPTLALAEQAYAELLERGVHRSQMELRVFDDEAGPSSGNFILEYKGTDVHFDSSWLDRISNRDDPNVGAGRQEVFWCCEVVLIVSSSERPPLAAVERLRANRA